MQAETLTIQATPARQAGILERSLTELPQKNWSRHVDALAKAYDRCPRVRMILSRNKDKFGVDYDDLKQDVWLVFEQKMLKILDSPANVYSVIFRCSELCARSLVNGRRELPLTVERGEDADEVAARMLEDAVDEDTDMAQLLIEELDTERAQDLVRVKLEKFGWPEGVPRDESAYRRAGRPMKEPAQVRTDDDEASMRINSPLIHQVFQDINVGPKVSPEAQAFATKPKRDRTRGLQPNALAVYQLRESLHVPMARIAEHIGINKDSLQNLIAGTYINEELAANVGKAMRKMLAEMRKDKFVKRALEQDVPTLSKTWGKLLGIEDVPALMRMVADINGLKWPTLYRWVRENRKPVDIYELAAVDRNVHEYAEALAAKVEKAAARRAAKKV